MWSRLRLIYQRMYLLFSNRTICLTCNFVNNDRGQERLDFQLRNIISALSLPTSILVFLIPGQLECLVLQLTQLYFRQKLRHRPIVVRKRGLLILPSTNTSKRVVAHSWAKLLMFTIESTWRTMLLRSILRFIKQIASPREWQRVFQWRKDVVNNLTINDDEFWWCDK